MIILALETSCDETAAAVIEGHGPVLVRGRTMIWPRFRVLTNVISSQVKLHARYGGVCPTLAKREHLKNLPRVLRRALAAAHLRVSDTDILAVTVGPGLAPALWTGVTFAVALAKKWQKPLVAVNHMEGHLLSVLLSEVGKTKSPDGVKLPAMALLVSGGHTELVLVEAAQSKSNRDLVLKIIGETSDDAAGEAFDKAARMLGLGYPGGPALEALAKESKKTQGIVSGSGFDASNLKLPRPMLHSKDYDFSFSGLKTALLYLLRNIREKRNRKDISDLLPQLAYEFQSAVVETLVAKTVRAVKEFGAQSVILAGGVANNKKLQKQLAEAILGSSPQTTLHIPYPSFTTDNAAMIAAAAYFHALKKDFVRDLSALAANGTLRLGTKTH